MTVKPPTRGASGRIFLFLGLVLGTLVGAFLVAPRIPGGYAEKFRVEGKWHPGSKLGILGAAGLPPPLPPLPAAAAALICWPS